MTADNDEKRETASDRIAALEARVRVLWAALQISMAPRPMLATGPPVMEQFWPAIEELCCARGAEYLGAGGNRVVFRLGDEVAKVPRDLAGCLSNRCEAGLTDGSFEVSEAHARYLERRNAPPPARARLEMVRGVPVAFMELVTPVEGDVRRIGQIGHTADGRLVTYDDYIPPRWPRRMLFDEARKLGI